ncbi:MAG: hypothetical protein ACLR0U_23410 [Enterocloster clostridioformis]
MLRQVDSDCPDYRRMARPRATENMAVGALMNGWRQKMVSAG